MKKVFNQKWILSAFLIAALGSQYYYSVSSQQILSADFSSEVAVSPDVSSPAPAPAAVAVPAPAPVAAPVPPPSATQGQAPQACADCMVQWTMPASRAKEIEEVLAWAAAEKERRAAPAAVPAPAPAPVATTPLAPETPEEICAIEPTASAKARCIRRENENLRKEADRDAMDLRNQEFEDKMADYADRYPGNLETLSSRFESLVRSYSGRRKIEPAVAQRVFAKYIEPLLRQRMNSADQSPESLQALQDTILKISNGLPQEYRGINNLIARDIKTAAETRSALVRSKLQEARQAYNDKDFTGSQELWAVAEQERRRLLTEYNGSPQDGISGYYDMLANNLKGADDVSNASLIPSVRNLFTRMNNESSNWLNVNFNTGDSSSTTGSNSRAGRGTTAAPSGGAPSINTSGAPSSIGPALPNSSNMTIGSPNSTMQGSRTRR